ncbi:MAG: WG repeat-containing protein [Candidatus Peribacteria bacterium]|jgi:hypothetical protein|nr:WG repeat-containing protein [Candidatus Peribacteria bacterium]
MNEKGEYGYINKNRAEVIHCQYRNVRDFSGGLAGVKNEKGKYGYVNKAGEEVIPCLYDYIWDVSEELVKVEKDGK